MNEKDVVVVLHNIRSTHNVGSIFRTADACGISKIYLTGYTPVPIDDFGRKRKDIAKVALGAEDTILWEKITNISSVITHLKKDGFEIIAVEQDKKAVDYRNVVLGKKSAIIMGNEVLGVSPSILKQCDVVAEIPMVGKKESLNVSVAFGVALFSFINT